AEPFPPAPLPPRVLDGRVSRVGRRRRRGTEGVSPLPGGGREAAPRARVEQNLTPSLNRLSGRPPQPASTTAGGTSTKVTKTNGPHPADLFAGVVRPLRRAAAGRVRPSPGGWTSPGRTASTGRSGRRGRSARRRSTPSSPPRRGSRASGARFERAAATAG